MITITEQTGQDKSRKDTQSVKCKESPYVVLMEMSVWLSAPLSLMQAHKNATKLNISSLLLYDCLQYSLCLFLWSIQFHLNLLSSLYFNLSPFSVSCQVFSLCVFLPIHTPFVGKLFVSLGRPSPPHHLTSWMKAPALYCPPLFCP